MSFTVLAMSSELKAVRVPPQSPKLLLAGVGDYELRQAAHLSLHSMKRRGEGPSRRRLS